MEKIIFQLLSFLYLYDSGILVPVCIRKQSLYTDFWWLALIHRAVGIPTSGACVNIQCRRYTDFWRRRGVCAKSVYRLLASKELNYWYNYNGTLTTRPYTYNDHDHNRISFTCVPIDKAIQD